MTEQKLYELASQLNILVTADAPTLLRLVNAAINDKLEEVALEIEKLEAGVYTSAQTPAGLVRAMKVKP